MSSRPDVMILGGGVIGLTCAYFLAREGVSVEVVDKGDFGQEASWAGAGILVPGSKHHARTPGELLHAHGVAVFPALSAELREKTGIDNGYLRCGGLEIVRPGEPVTREWRGEGVDFEVLDERALRRLEPMLAAKGIGTVYHLPDMAQIRNPRHLKALLAACAAVGVKLLPNCPIHGFDRAGDSVTAVRTNRESRVAGKYLMATGAWSDGLLDPLGIRLGIHPVRGQIAMLNTRTPRIRRVVMLGKRYMVQRPDGRLLVGSTEEDVGFDKNTTAGAIADLLQFACSLVPLSDAALERCWAGLRPASPDGLPYLGPVPGLTNLYVAAGHFRSGIQMSPATGLLVKELLLGQPTTLPVEPFRLDR
jgi:glycine oxidase